MAKSIYDLEALALNLRVEGKHPSLTDWIQRCADIGSAHQDVGQAIESLEALAVLTGKYPKYGLPDDLRGTVAGSLTVSAIIFYARATDTEPIKGERRKWFSVGKLRPESRETHKEVLTLRNKQVAHFGRSLAVDGELMIEETTVFRPHDPTHPIGFVAARSHNKAAFSVRFTALAVEVRELAERMASKAFIATRSALRAALADDPLLADRIKMFPVGSKKLIETDAKPNGEWTVDGGARRYSGNVSGPIIRP